MQGVMQCKLTNYSDYSYATWCPPTLNVFFFFFFFLSTFFLFFQAGELAKDLFVQRLKSVVGNEMLYSAMARLQGSN